MIDNPSLLCTVCNRHFPAADGECPCTARLDSCACGNRDWELRDDGVVVCCACGTEPGATPDEVDDED